MKSILLVISLSFVCLQTGISCSCRVLPDFQNNTYVRDYGKNCVAILDSLAYHYEINDEKVETGHFTLLDTLSEMKVNIGQSIVVYGSHGPNCGVEMNKLSIGDTYLLSLFDGIFEEIENDTFFLGGCGEFYLNLSNPEYSEWTTTELKQLINGIISNTEEVGLKEFINIFPNPVSENIYIQSENLSIQNIQVYNGVGKLVLNLKGLKSSSQEVVVSQLHTGFYILQINTLEGTAYKKILKN